MSEETLIVALARVSAKVDALLEEEEERGTRRTNVLLAWLLLFLVFHCTIVVPVLKAAVTATESVVEGTADVAEQFLAGKVLDLPGEILPIGQGCEVTDVRRWRSSHPVTGEPTFHNGVDLGCAEHHPLLFAPMAGKFEIIQPENSNGGGLVLRVTSAEGFVVQVMHCHEAIAKSGDVKAGQAIGYAQANVGTKEIGSSTGPHLHIELFRLSPDGNRTYYDINERLVYGLLQP